MENKKLVNILTKDMAQLEELIGDIKLKQQFDALEMEFIHNRAKGVLQLLQMLSAQEEPMVTAIGEENKILEKLKGKAERVSQITSELKTEKSEPEKPQEEPDQEEKEQTLPGVVPEPSHPGKEDLSADENIEDSEKPAQHDDDDDMLQDEIIKPQAGSRLGDSFLKSKAVGELITDQVKLEYKLSNRPVNNIQSAIGINDRFQYIRELFDGDNKKFLETVKTLDSMDNISEAVDYLRANYKWKKNETSLKFVNLVKRRFQDTANGA